MVRSCRAVMGVLLAVSCYAPYVFRLPAARIEVVASLAGSASPWQALSARS